MDRDNPWIALLKVWIRALRGQSMDCTAPARSRMDCATTHVSSVRTEEEREQGDQSRGNHCLPFGWRRQRRSSFQVLGKVSWILPIRLPRSWTVKHESCSAIVSYSLANWYAGRVRQSSTVRHAVFSSGTDTMFSSRICINDYSNEVSLLILQALILATLKKMGYRRCYWGLMSIASVPAMSSYYSRNSRLHAATTIFSHLM